jgi:hypothetical protein
MVGPTVRFRTEHTRPMAPGVAIIRARLDQQLSVLETSSSLLIVEPEATHRSYKLLDSSLKGRV